MKKSILLFVFSMLLAILSAQVPTTFHFQGAIKDADGTAINDTKYIEFLIYDVETGGTALWSEGPLTVVITEGLFSHEIGSVTPLPEGLFNTSPLYITFSLASGEMTPRQKLVSVPFALKAASSDEDWEINGSYVTNLNKSVGIGTDNPQTRLEVNPMMRLTPSQMTFPCDLTIEGSLYYDELLKEFCFCDGTLWQQFDGQGLCECIDADGDGADSCDPDHPYDTDGLPADCDDGNDEIFPGNVEYCDGFDNDCDPLTGNGTGESNFGNPCDGADEDLCNEGTIICIGGVLACSDFTDNTPDLCDGIDNDCNPATADGSGETLLGSPCDGPDSDLCEEGVYVCSGGTLLCTDNTGDSEEICDGIDNDCDGDIDEEAIGGSIYYLDADGDGYGDDGYTLEFCSDPGSPWVLIGGDCDDSNDEVNPGQPELCDGIDNDCNPATADGSEEAGAGSACDGPDSDLCEEGVWDCASGTFICNDNTGDNIEVCDDGEDNDCDGLVDGDDPDCI